MTESVAINFHNMARINQEPWFYRFVYDAYLQAIVEQRYNRGPFADGKYGGYRDLWDSLQERVADILSKDDAFLEATRNFITAFRSQETRFGRKTSSIQIFYQRLGTALTDVPPDADKRQILGKTATSVYKECTRIDGAFPHDHALAAEFKRVIDQNWQNGISEEEVCAQVDKIRLDPWFFMHAYSAFIEAFHENWSNTVAAFRDSSRISRDDIQSILDEPNFIARARNLLSENERFMAEFEKRRQDPQFLRKGNRDNVKALIEAYLSLNRYERNPYSALRLKVFLIERSNNLRSAKGTTDPAFSNYVLKCLNTVVQQSTFATPQDAAGAVAVYMRDTLGITDLRESQVRKIILEGADLNPILWEEINENIDFRLRQSQEAPTMETPYRRSRGAPTGDIGASQPGRRREPEP